MHALIRFADAVARLLGHVAMAGLAVLLLSMLYEVCARYVFGAPTLWAFDISYMLNGSVFLLAAAYALRVDAHVRIDFLSQRLPRRAQHAINAAACLAALFPILVMLSWVAAEKAWKAFATGEVENVSPWAPLVWPFYTAIAVGLSAFALQFLAEGLRRLFAFAGREVAE